MCILALQYSKCERLYKTPDNSKTCWDHVTREQQAGASPLCDLCIIAAWE